VDAVEVVECGEGPLHHLAAAATQNLDDLKIWAFAADFGAAAIVAQEGDVRKRGGDLVRSQTGYGES
jgi:hypothetical protein